MHYGLGYSSNTNLTAKLFPGAIYDSYQMSVYVQVYDDDGAYTTFNIADKVTVRPDENDLTQLNTIMDKLVFGNVDFESNKILNEGSFLMRISELQRLSSLLNIQSLADKLGVINLIKANQDKSITHVIFPQTYGPLADYQGVIPVKVKLYLKL